MKHYILVTLGLTLMLNSQTFAQTQKGLSFQAVIREPGGSLVNKSGLTITAKLLTSNNCIVREEEFTGVNINDGYLNLVVGQGSASGADPSFTLSKAMDNSATISSLTCLNSDGTVNTGVTTYDPTTGSGHRKLRLTMVIDGVPVEADFNMRAVAYAVNSDTLEGKSANNFIQTKASANLTQAKLEEFITSLTSISGNSVRWNGTSFESYNPIANNAVPDSAIAGLAYSKITGVPSPLSQIGGLTCADGKLLKMSAGSWICGDESGVGTENDPTVQPYAKAAPGSGLQVTSGQINVKMADIQAGATGTWGISISGNAATATSATTATGFSGSLSGDVSGTQGATKVDKINGVSVSSAVAGDDGKFLKFSNGSGWQPQFVKLSELKNATGLSSAFNVASCTAGETLIWSSITDQFGCQAIVLSSSQVTAALGYTPLSPSNNLSDLGSAATARTNLGLGTAAVKNHPASGNAAATEVVLGNDTRLSDSRAPSGSAGGDLTGSFPSPTLAAVGTAGTYTKVTTDSKGRVTSGGTLNIADIKSTNTGNWFTASGACPSGQHLEYISATDSVSCQAYSLTAAQVNAGLPTQTGNSGKYLVTDGTNSSWATISAGTASYITKTANYTAAVGDSILADTSGGSFTITLPATPAVNSVIRIIDTSGTFNTNNLIIAPNAADSVMGQSAGTTLNCDIKHISFDLIYTGSTYGWRMY